MKKMTWQEVHQVGLDILKDIHEFCVENDIKYSLSGGSLLGAIRHNGFIPGMMTLISKCLVLNMRNLYIVIDQKMAIVFYRGN